MSTTTTAKPTQVILKGVRLSYPNLFAAKTVKGNESGDAKFSATFLLDKEKDAAQITAIEKVITSILAEKNKGKKLAADKLCLRDGDLKEDTDGYEGHMYLTSSNTARPSVVDRPSVRDAQGKLVPMDAHDSRLFAGCYVNAAVTLWFQDNANGKRINGSLDSVQYSGPGERFGAPPTNPDDAFGGLEDSGEEDDANL